MMMSLVFAALLFQQASALNARPTAPIMGWNSYNYYHCSITEDIIKNNAIGLINNGLRQVGYRYVTPDCGWNAPGRDSAGRQIWDPNLFPSGGQALGAYLHEAGMYFGIYSGGGFFQCGSSNLPASLNNEQVDAEAYAEWGADSLKYDNCYTTSPTVQVDSTGAVATSPTRFQTMASALASTNRSIVFQVCQWGIGSDVGSWASAIAGSWRVSNDIYGAWRSIWRITNEVVPYYKYTKVGAYPDMDMLVVGLKALSLEEERFHFGMWAINKSPLIIGAPMQTSITPIASLQLLANTEVIAINQDPLGQQAQLVRRFTEEEFDIWAGNLSNSRMVVGLANWRNDTQTVFLDLNRVLGIASASARDVWAAQDLGTISGTFDSLLSGHQLQLLVLSNIVMSNTPIQRVGHYPAYNAQVSGQATRTLCGTNQCMPDGTKVGFIGEGAAGASVTFPFVTASSPGIKTLRINFIQYDISFDNAFTDGTNTRNMTISVNGGIPKRYAFPISGGDWSDAGSLMIDVPGFNLGTNKVVFQASGSGTEYAPDLVSFDIFE